MIPFRHYISSFMVCISHWLLWKLLCGKHYVIVTQEKYAKKICIMCFSCIVHWLSKQKFMSKELQTMKYKGCYSYDGFVIFNHVKLHIWWYIRALLFFFVRWTEKHTVKRAKYTTKGLSLGKMAHFLMNIVLCNLCILNFCVCVKLHSKESN